MGDGGERGVAAKERSETGTYYFSPLSLHHSQNRDGEKLNVPVSRTSIMTSSIEIPANATTLFGFSDWSYSQSFPQEGQVTFVDGDVSIDLSGYAYESHVNVTLELCCTLGGIIREASLGEYYVRGGRLVNYEANISLEPDSMFATGETLKSGRLGPPAGRDPKLAIDLVGTPDWICEVVSDSSEEKDTQLLRAKYFAAGIPEYWLIDARGAAIDFQVLVPGANGYEGAKRDEAWQWSPTFSRWFELTREENEVGRWTYELKSKG